MAELIPRARIPETSVGALPGVRPDAPTSREPLVQGLAVAQRGLAEFAKQAQERADVTALMQARRELSDWEGSTFRPDNPEGIAKYKGKDALGAQDALLGDLDRRADQIRFKLSPSQQARFDGIALSFRDSVQGRLVSHADREYSAFESAERKATLDNIGQDAVSAGLAGDFGLADIRIQEALGIARAAYQSQGFGEEAIKASERGIVSGVRTQTIMGTAMRDPFAAEDLYDRYADQLTPEDRARVERELRPYVEDQQADADVMWAVGGNPAVAVRADAAGVQAQYATLGAQHGFRTTSTTRSKEENERVGGVENSQHLEHNGTARDWSVKGKSPEQIKAFVSDLEAAGFEVITKTHGTGPHIHAELPPQRSGSAPAAGRAATKADALARVESIADPRRRQAAERKLRGQWSIEETRRAEQDRAVSETVNLAVENADPDSGATLRQLLGGNYERAAERGWIPSLEARWLSRQTRQIDTSSPQTVLAMDEAIYRAALGGEAARAGLANFNPYDPTLPLSASDRKRYADAQFKLLSGNPKEKAAVASEAEINSAIKQYTVATMGIPEKQIGTDTPNGRKAWQFNTDMRLWMEQYENDKGQKPGYEEVIKHADLLTMQGAIETPGRFYGTNKEQFRVADLNIPPLQLTQIEEALRQEGRPVSAENIADKWMRFGGGAR